MDSFREKAMQRFLQRHSPHIVGVLAGFDRILFRGTLRSISYLAGRDKFLGALGLGPVRNLVSASSLSDLALANFI
jgi:hypothetical protein